jgi:hypothetical protein
MQPALRQAQLGHFGVFFWPLAFSRASSSAHAAFRPRP